MKKNVLGVTFIELILYISIVSIMMMALIPFAWNVIGGGVKSNTQREVFSNARFITERIKYEIRNATGINSLTSTQISLSNLNSSLNPTIISLISNNIQIQQGSGSATILNSTDTKIQNLQFTNYSSFDSKTKHIKFTITVSANYPNAGQRQEYNDLSTIESSAELRSN